MKMQKIETVQPEDVTVEFLREFEKERGWTHGDLAKSLGSTPDTVKGWFKNDKIPAWVKVSVANIIQNESKDKKIESLEDQIKDIFTKINGFKTLMESDKQTLP